MIKKLLLILFLSLTACGDGLATSKPRIYAEKVWLNGSKAITVLEIRDKELVAQTYGCGTFGKVIVIREDIPNIFIDILPAPITDYPGNRWAENKYHWSYIIEIHLPLNSEILGGKEPDVHRPKSSTIPGNQLEEIK